MLNFMRIVYFFFIKEDLYLSPQRSSSYHTLSSLSPLSEFSGSIPEYSDVSDVENNIAKAITVASVDVEEGVCVSPDSKIYDRDVLRIFCKKISRLNICIDC